MMVAIRVGRSHGFGGTLRRNLGPMMKMHGNFGSPTIQVNKIGMRLTGKTGLHGHMMIGVTVSLMRAGMMRLPKMNFQ
jgi:hypothetical protein